MGSLPSSIEASLAEAGFSATEIVILKRMLEEDAMTLRTLALKTGRSTGVLDQAMKKLLKKGIVIKENINDQPKYVLQSLQSIARWMEKDVADKHDMLERRHRNFEAFMDSITQEKGRPDIEHFDGEEGIKKAYAKLLDSGDEMLVYLPIKHKEEEDPLREFRVQYFRERRRRGIFQRIIAEDTPLGRRFQGRDIFEYRKTILVPPELFPVGFEHIIIGEMYACFDHEAQKVSFIHYPQLAKSQRAFFEAIWKNPNREITVQELEQRTQQPAPDAQPIRLKTRIFSGLREFLLSPRSIATLAIFALVSVGLTYGMFRYTQSLNLMRMKEQVKSVASTAASQFNPNDLEQLQIESDWKKPEWAKVVNQMKEIRVNNERITFVYIFRKSKEQPNGVEFIADSHSLDPYANTDKDPNNDVDVDNNGIIDDVDFLQWPGQLYSTAPNAAVRALTEAGPSTNETFYEDHWGKFISGYAPILNSKGEIIAVLAADMAASKLDEFTSQVFQPILFFILIFISFVIVRLAAFNRPLAKDLWELLQMRKVLLLIALCAEISIGVTYIFYLHTLNLMKEELSERLKSITATVAPEFDAIDLERIHWAKDMKTDAYQRVFNKLNEIRERNKDIQWAYVQRPTKDPNISIMIADADSNYNLPFWKDSNQDGKEQPEELNVAPGMAMYFAGDILTEALRRPFAQTDFYSDQWGTYVSGFAPIKNASGSAVAFVGLDMNISNVLQLTQQKFSVWFWFTGSFGLLIGLCIFIKYVRK